jgi:hypothetical protein
MKNVTSEVKYLEKYSKPSNVLPLSSNKIDYMLQQAIVDSSASNLLPLENTKMRTGTYKILPQYSELDEKSTRK